jgi:hypothetical protein
MQRCCLQLLMLAMICASAQLAGAQGYPTKPIRAIVQAGACSAVNIIPRVVFDQPSAQLGQAIVVENRAGAGGTIATAAVAKSNADRYTILATSSAHTVSPWIHANLSYDASRDLSAIIAIGTNPHVIAIERERRGKHLVELRRQRRGCTKVRYSGLHHRELVSPETRDGVGPAHHVPHALGDILQEQITCRMAERIVDILEMIEIEIEHSKDRGTADS